MTDKFIRKFGEENRQVVMRTAWQVSGDMVLDGKRVQITIEPITRSMEQNAKLHAMLADIAQQKTWNGKKLSLGQWKMLFVSGHCIATGGSAEMAIGLENEIVNLRESTAKMSVARCASLIEYIQAWAVENGVKFKAREFF